MKSKFWVNHKSTVLYGVLLAILLFLLKWLELRFIIFDHSYEIYVGFLAFIFTGLGIWLTLKLTKPKIETRVIEKEVFMSRSDDFEPNTSLIEKLQISKRELEILNLLAKGLSNQELAEALCVSLSTVKSHNQNLFDKLESNVAFRPLKKLKACKSSLKKLTIRILKPKKWPKV